MPAKPFTCAAFVGLLLCLGCTLKDPIMILPPRLLADADVLPVNGKQGLLLLNPPIRFGPFHTTQVKRGWRNDSSFNWWALDVDERWDASHATSFVLAGPAGERWEAQCLSRAHKRRLEKATGGIHLDERGFGLDRRTVEAISYEVLQCAFQNAAHHLHWELMLTDTDPSGFGGVLVDDQHMLQARVSSVREQTGRPYYYDVPRPVGFVIETAAGAAVGVERAFDGKVILSHAVPPQQATVLAAVATALLIWEPLRI